MKQRREDIRYQNELRCLNFNTKIPQQIQREWDIEQSRKYSNPKNISLNSKMKMSYIRDEYIKKYSKQETMQLKKEL